MEITAFQRFAAEHQGGIFPLQQVAQRFVECLRRVEQTDQGGAQWFAQRVDTGAPVVGDGFEGGLGEILDHFLAKQLAAVEGVLFEHALAPAVNGRDGGVVHPLGGQGQAPGTAGPVVGGGTLLRKVVTQCRQ